MYPRRTRALQSTEAAPEHDSWRTSRGGTRAFSVLLDVRAWDSGLSSSREDIEIVFYVYSQLWPYL